MALQLHSRVSTKSQFHLVKQIKPPLVGTKLTLYISSTDAEWSNKEKFRRNARKKHNSKGQIILTERKLSAGPTGNWSRRISSFIHHANLYTFITLEQAGLRRFNSQLTLPICQSSHNHFDFRKWRFFSMATARKIAVNGKIDNPSCQNKTHCNGEMKEQQIMLKKQDII